jgi:hypothetical protein
MEKYQECIQKADNHLQAALYILTRTYPMVNDPKLLVGVLDNINHTLVSTMEILLQFERAKKTIPPIRDNDESKLNLFKLKIVDMYHIDENYISLIEDVQDILSKHSKSPVEFTRKDMFVICTEEYKLRTISVDQMKKYISLAQLFLKEVTDMVKGAQSA